MQYFFKSNPSSSRDDLPHRDTETIRLPLPIIPRERSCTLSRLEAHEVLHGYRTAKK